MKMNSFCILLKHRIFSWIWAWIKLPFFIPYVNHCFLSILGSNITYHNVTTSRTWEQFQQYHSITIEMNFQIFLYINREI